MWIYMEPAVILISDSLYHKGHTLWKCYIEIVYTYLLYIYIVTDVFTNYGEIKGTIYKEESKQLCINDDMIS